MNPDHISPEQVNPHLKFKKPATTKAEDQVKESEDASLQDESYSFDSDNTGIEEYHDVDDAVEVREDDDYLQ